MRSANFFIMKIAKIWNFTFCWNSESAFIGKQILDSLINIDIISKSDATNLYIGINSISSQLNRDLNYLTIKDFKIKYGHLRPNTYCSSLNYEKTLEYFKKKKFKNKNYKI